jgi:hypothetical protein
MLEQQALPLALREALGEGEAVPPPLRVRVGDTERHALSVREPGGEALGVVEAVPQGEPLRGALREPLRGGEGEGEGVAPPVGGAESDREGLPL